MKRRAKIAYRKPLNYAFRNDRVAPHHGGQKTLNPSVYVMKPVWLRCLWPTGERKPLMEASGLEHIREALRRRGWGSFW